RPGPGAASGRRLAAARRPRPAASAHRGAAAARRALPRTGGGVATGQPAAGRARLLRRWAGG
nr:hypothetical protein [Tanacetum cinerariifolium]